MNVKEYMTRLGDQSPEQLLAQASERLPFWVSLALAGMIAWYLSRIVWAVFPAPAAVQWTPPTALRATTTVSNRDYSDLAAAQLFGQASDDDTPPVVEETLDAPDTRLNLSLRATVAATEDRFAHAIIADGDGQEDTYFLKDPIPGGASLHRVHTDRVILNRAGILEALRLPREFAGAAPRPASQTRRTTRPAAAPAPTVQEIVQQNVATFTDIVRPQPFMPNGQLKGYRLYPGRNRQQFSELGLRPGDLVTEINGLTLNNPQQGMEVFSSLATATQVTLTVERGGQPEVISLDTAELAAATGRR